MFLGVWTAMLHLELFFLLHSLGCYPPVPYFPHCLCLIFLTKFVLLALLHPSLLGLSPGAGHSLRASTTDAELGC